MAKKARKKSIMKQLFWIITSFILGYMISLIIDLTSITTWVKQTVLNQTQHNTRATHNIAKAQPEFEFYTLLSKDHGKIAIPEKTIASPTPIPIEITQTKQATQYQVQLAAFNHFKEANELRAALLLKGYIVNITPVVQAGVELYRVVSEVKNSRQEAEQLQMQFFQRERIHGMIRASNT